MLGDNGNTPRLTPDPTNLLLFERRSNQQFPSPLWESDRVRGAPSLVTLTSFPLPSRERKQASSLRSRVFFVQVYGAARSWLGYAGCG